MRAATRQEMEVPSCMGRAGIRDSARTSGWMTAVLLLLAVAGLMGILAVRSMEKGLRSEKEAAMTASHRAQLNAREDDIASLRTRIGELEKEVSRYRDDLSVLTVERDRLNERLSAREVKTPTRRPSVKPTPTPADDLSGLLNDDPLTGLKKQRPKKTLEL